jgi:hypothetical protein
MFASFYRARLPYSLVSIVSFTAPILFIYYLPSAVDIMTGQGWQAGCYVGGRQNLPVRVAFVSFDDALCRLRIGWFTQCVFGQNLQNPAKLVLACHNLDSPLHNDTGVNWVLECRSSRQQRFRFF